ncbi:type III CRISPR-associated RAMP protein Csx7 [Pseudothermotoga sp.]
MNFELIPLDKIRKKCVIEFDLVNKTAFRIGTSIESIDPQEPDNAVLKSDGKPIIPGSSLKGVFRSAYEGLFDENCVWCKEIANKEKKQKFNANLESIVKHGKPLDGFHICDKCLLFGNNFIRGRLYFTDSYPENFKLALRDGVMIDRDFECAAEERKYDFEVVEPGAVFKVKIVAVNVEEEQLKKLEQIMNLIELGVVRIGGGKSRGLGVCGVKNYQIRWL